MILLAATGHQIAKTVTWVIGIGALESRRMKPLLDRWRPRIDRWNRHPNWMFFFAGAVGVPPMLLIGFIAEPILRMRFWPFTFACFSLRTLRYAVLAIVPLLVK
jgi:membrane protein YqaA with SNARE-associated domain